MLTKFKISSIQSKKLLSSTSTSFNLSFSTTFSPQTRSSTSKNLEFEARIVVIKVTNLQVGIAIEIGTSIEEEKSKVGTKT